LNSPLLNDNNIDGAKYVLLNITYGTQAVLMDEISDITDYIQEEAGSTADVIWGHGYDESLGDKLCVTIIATGFNTTPHTGLSMKAPKKNIMNLEDDSPEINTNESEQLTEPVTNNIEESLEETPELNPSENTMKRFVLEEEDETVQENEITNNTEESDKSSFYEQNTQQNDGKVRFLLEDDEMPNLDSDLKQSENTQILETDLMTANDEEKIVDQVKQVEPKAISDERLERIKKATDKLRSPLGLNEMESEPAYKRRNVDLKDVKYSDDSSSSRYTLWENINDSGEKETGLSDNNSFLHDNVD
jgi:cell division protein FtsZ